MLFKALDFVFVFKACFNFLCGLSLTHRVPYLVFMMFTNVFYPASELFTEQLQYTEIEVPTGSYKLTSESIWLLWIYFKGVRLKEINTYYMQATCFGFLLKKKLLRNL